VEHEPDILAMSALLTTTASEQRKVIKSLGDQGLRDKVQVVVGGGAITPVFAKEIGADGYAPTAPMAVKLFRTLVEQGE
jgi:5-methyltetrahydrofolate--homocysteine methyltransferase